MTCMQRHSNIMDAIYPYMAWCELYNVEVMYLKNQLHLSVITEWTQLLRSTSSVL